MEIDHKTKTIFLTKEHTIGDWWRGGLVAIKYDYHVSPMIKKLIQPDINNGYRVVFKSIKGKVLMVYNK